MLFIYLFLLFYNVPTLDQIEIQIQLASDSKHSKTFENTFGANCKLQRAISHYPPASMRSIYLPRVIYERSYVEETKSQLNKRLSQHRRDLQSNKPHNGHGAIRTITSIYEK